VWEGAKGGGVSWAKGQGSKSTLSSTRSMMAVCKKKKRQGSCGLQPWLLPMGTCGPERNSCHRFLWVGSMEGRGPMAIFKFENQ